MQAKPTFTTVNRAIRLASCLTIILLTVLLPSSCKRSYDGPRAYVSNEKDGTITVIDIAHDQRLSTIQVGARPRGIRLSPDGKMLWVALSYPSNSSNVTR